MVQSVQDYAILMLTPEGNVATWNAGAERFKGYRAEEIIGRHFSTFYPPQDVAAGKPERELAVAMAAGRMEDEGWRVRKDGTQFWANVVITALRDPDGTLRGFGKVTRDLTERRAQEQAISDREQLVTGVLAAATERADFGPFEEMLQVLSRPYEEQPGRESYLAPPLPSERVLQTFCGT